MDTKETLKKIINRCDILYNTELISQESLIKAYIQFINQTFSEEKHNVSVVMHTGSVCFDIVSLIFAAVSTLVLDEGEVDSLVDSLEEGDIVVFEKERYRFLGIEKKKLFDDKPEIKYAELEQDGKGHYKRSIPEKMWFGIRPYSGTSKTLDGRGIRTSADKRNRFISTMMDVSKDKIPGLIKTSSVVVMPRNKADDILRNTVFFDRQEGVGYKLLDLVTASYYTEADEYYYSGNAEKADPNLKITSKLSVARELILSPIDNTIVGLVVLEEDGANQSRSELEELMNRRSLGYVYVSYHINSDMGEALVSEYEKANLFACTKEYLLNNETKLNTYNTYTAELEKQVGVILNQEVNIISAESSFSWDDVKKIKSYLKSIRHSDFSDENKDDFVIQAGALFNLLITAPFSMSEMENYLASSSNVAVLSPADRIELLKDYLNKLSYSLQDKAKYVLEKTEALYSESYEQSLKGKELKRILSDHRMEKIAIIIPKAYYEPIMRVSLRHYMGTGRISFYTPNRFDNTKVFDRIIVLGDYDGKRYSTFKCRSARLIDVLLYEFEGRVFAYHQKKARNTEVLYNKRLKLIYTEEFEDQYFKIEDDIKEYIEDDKELDDFLNSLNTIAIKHYVSGGAKAGTQMINVTRIGRCAEGESVLFSKNYKAIVFNEAAGEAKETSVEDLEEGDVLVFTKNDSVTKGIVDEILERLLDKKLLSESIKEAYNKSIYWKDVLRDYVEVNNLTSEELGKKMKQCGSTKHHATIRNWIQPFSHVVGPKDEESYRHIAELTQDEAMLSNPKSYWEACNIVRGERIKILKIIADAIVKSLGGKIEESNKILDAVYENIDNISIRRQIDSLTTLEEEYAAPIGMVNRPINI